MSDIRLFKTQGNKVTQLAGGSVALEKSLQNLIETHLETFLGVRLLASEHPTSGSTSGRIDTLGIDENGCPVIIEYKRSTNQNVINQGLFYLNWLMEHRAEFTLMVLNKFGKAVSESVEWSNPRLICIASNFTKFDEHAVQQMNRNIDLMRYLRFGDELLLLELVNAVQTSQTVAPSKPTKKKTRPGTKSTQAKSIADYLSRADTELQDLYHATREFLVNLGDDVIEKQLKWYYAFRRIKNFACLVIHPNKKQLLVFLHLDLKPSDLEKGFTVDVSGKGHQGTGNLQVIIKSMQHLERAKPLLIRSYESR